MKKSEWQAIRRVVLAAQKGGCAAGKCQSSGLDVVVDDVGEYAAFCRSCRLRRDGRSRAAKARHTVIEKRRARLGQQEIFA